MPERICWLIVISASLYSCLCLIVNIYQKWNSSPVIVTFANRLSSVWEVPFPAITICPETKTKQTLYNYTDAYNKYAERPWNMTAEELKRLEQTSLVCDLSYDNITDNPTIEDDSIDFLVKISPNAKDLYWNCAWNHMSDKRPCDVFLSSVLVDAGVCSTFNMLGREELFTDAVYHFGNFLSRGKKSTNWNLETGYAQKIDSNDFPRRTTMSLYISMAIYGPDIDNICRGAGQGYKILLHNPAELPRVDRKYLLVPLNQVIVVSIKPDMMKTSEQLVHYDPQQRQCYFSHEKQLKYFRSYTQGNCELECLINHTLTRCGCVAFYMPRDRKTRICGQGNFLCMGEAEQIMTAIEMDLDTEAFDDDSKPIYEHKCNCLPSCTSLSYNVETSQIDLDRSKMYEAMKVNHSEFLKYRHTVLFFSFKEGQFITTERKEIYGLTDFIANCGGLLGLFIGFSFLSIVEIVYFMTLRLMCNIRKYGRYRWSGSREIIICSERLASETPKNKFLSRFSHGKFSTEHSLAVIESGPIFNVINKKPF